MKASFHELFVSITVNSNIVIIKLTESDKKVNYASKAKNRHKKRVCTANSEDEIFDFGSFAHLFSTTTNFKAKLLELLETVRFGTFKSYSFL